MWPNFPINGEGRVQTSSEYLLSKAIIFADPRTFVRVNPTASNLAGALFFFFFMPAIDASLPNHPSLAPCEANINIDRIRSTILVMDRVLRVINERLQGRYNLAVPRSAGLGAADAGNDLPLSVQGQVR